MKDMKLVSLPFTVMALAFCLCFIADGLMDLKVCSAFGVPFVTGILVIPVSYIASDCLVEVYGYRMARFVMWMTFAAHVLLLCLLQITCAMPASPSWEGEEHFQFIFGLAPRVALASMAAFLAGSTVNACIMSKMKVASGGAGFKWRAFVSTVFGETADAFAYFTLAFAGMLPMTEIIIMAAVQAAGKSAYEACVLPVTERIVAYVKAHDGIDTFDSSVSYNPFSLRV